MTPHDGDAISIDPLGTLEIRLAGEVTAVYASGQWTQAARRMPKAIEPAGSTPTELTQEELEEAIRAAEAS